MAAIREFVDYCVELLSSIGDCSAKRMFGGWGLALDGMNLALIADLGDGEKLWLKADANSSAQFAAHGCQRFTYDSHKKGEPVQRSMNYYSAPAEAMDSALDMEPWARLALDSARRAVRAAGPTRTRRRSAVKPPGA